MSAAIQRASLRALVQSADCKLPGTIGMKMALVALARLFDDRTGLCRGSNKTIGALMSCSADQAKRYLAALCALRVGAQALVSKIPCPGRSTTYMIHLDVLAALGDCRPQREAVDNSDSSLPTPGMETVNPLQICPPPPADLPHTPGMDAPRTDKGTDMYGGGTEARAGDATACATFPPLPVFEDLKTEQPIARPRFADAPRADGKPTSAALVAAPGCPTGDGPTDAEIDAAFAQFPPSLPYSPFPFPEPAPTPAEPAAVDAATLAKVNAQRAANGKRQALDLVELAAEAEKAGITPAAAVAWLLERPTRNYFRADYYRPATAGVAAKPASPSELTPEARAALAMRARYEAGIVLPASAGPITRPDRAAEPLRTVTLRQAAPTAVGGGTGTGWARAAIDCYLAGQPVSNAKLTNAAAALGLTVRDLKAQRAATLAPVAA